MNFFKGFHGMLDEMEEFFGSDPFKETYTYKETTTSTTQVNGVKVVTVNGKTTVTVNGVEYVPKEKKKG